MIDDRKPVTPIEFNQAFMRRYFPQKPPDTSKHRGWRSELLVDSYGDLESETINWIS